MRHNTLDLTLVFFGLTNINYLPEFISAFILNY